MARRKMTPEEMAMSTGLPLTTRQHGSKRSSGVWHRALNRFQDWAGGVANSTGKAPMAPKDNNAPWIIKN